MNESTKPLIRTIVTTFAATCSGMRETDCACLHRSKVDMGHSQEGTIKGSPIGKTISPIPRESSKPGLCKLAERLITRG